MLQCLELAYIPWARVHDFVKGEEARSDAPCKFVCQGTPTNEKGKLMFPRWNSYSAIFMFACNMHSDCDTCMVQCYTVVLPFFLAIYGSHSNHLLWFPSDRYHCQYGPNDNASHIPLVTNDMYHKKKKTRREGKIHTKWKGAHRSPDIRTDARIVAAKGMPVWICRQEIVPTAFSGRNIIP